MEYRLAWIYSGNDVSDRKDEESITFNELRLKSRLSTDSAKSLEDLAEYNHGWSSYLRYSYAIFQNEDRITQWVPLRDIFNTPIYPFRPLINGDSKMANAPQQLYEYAVTYNPARVVDATGTDRTPEAEVVVGPDTVLASSEEKARVLVARNIPSDWVEKIDELTIRIKLF